MTGEIGSLLKPLSGRKYFILSVAEGMPKEKMDMHFTHH